MKSSFLHDGNEASTDGFSMECLASKETKRILDKFEKLVTLVGKGTLFRPGSDEQLAFERLHHVYNEYFDSSRNFVTPLDSGKVQSLFDQLHMLEGFYYCRVSQERANEAIRRAETYFLELIWATHPLARKNRARAIDEVTVERRVSEILNPKPHTPSHLGTLTFGEGIRRQLGKIMGRSEKRK